jgi:hypothetical protein
MIEAVKELIGASYLSGNASTWAWLHLEFPQNPKAADYYQNLPCPILTISPILYGRLAKG